LTGTRATARALMLVGAGGALGSAGRYGLGRAFPVPSTSFPTTTLVVNLVGAFGLGLLLEHLLRHGQAEGWIRLALGIGALGAFTTFSTLTVEVAGLLRDGETGLAVAYLCASVTGGLVACLAGLTAGGWRRGPVPDEGES